MHQDVNPAIVSHLTLADLLQNGCQSALKALTMWSHWAKGQWAISLLSCVILTLDYMHLAKSQTNAVQDKQSQPQVTKRHIVTAD